MPHETGPKLKQRADLLTILTRAQDRLRSVEPTETEPMDIEKLARMLIYLALGELALVAWLTGLTIAVMLML